MGEAVSFSRARPQRAAGESSLSSSPSTSFPKTDLTSPAQPMRGRCHHLHMTCGDTEAHRQSKICPRMCGFWPQFVFPLPNFLCPWHLLALSLRTAKCWQVRGFGPSARWPHLVLGGVLQKLRMKDTEGRGSRASCWCFYSLRTILACPLVPSLHTHPSEAARILAESRQVM